VREKVKKRGRHAHALQDLQSMSRTLCFCILRKFQRILTYTVGQITVRFPPERSPPEYQFICTYTKRPPVDGISISAFVKNLGRHISHGAGHTSEQALFGKVNCDVKVRQVSVAALVEEDVVRLEISMRI
jgi:hypothetical protein